MAPRGRDLQLTAVAGKGDDAGEEERLLGAYDDEGSESLRRIQVGVTGMTCAACSNSVESALRSLDGVVTASVALLQNKAEVSFNSSLLKVLFHFLFEYVYAACHVESACTFCNPVCASVEEWCSCLVVFFFFLLITIELSLYIVVLDHGFCLIIGVVK